MKRIYAKPWRPTAMFVVSVFMLLVVLFSAGFWVVVFNKQELLNYVNKTKPLFKKFNNKGQLNLNYDSKAGPLSDAITLKKIVELSKLKREY